jgi:hypothetical protein
MAGAFIASPLHVIIPVSRRAGAETPAFALEHPWSSSAQLTNRIARQAGTDVNGAEMGNDRVSTVWALRTLETPTAVDPEPTFLTGLAGGPRRRKADDEVPCDRAVTMRA